MFQFACWCAGLSVASLRVLWLIIFPFTRLLPFQNKHCDWNMQWLNVTALRRHVLMSVGISHRLICRFMPLIYDLTFTKGKGHALQIKSLARICPETKFTSHFLPCVQGHYAVSIEPGMKRVQAAICQIIKKKQQPKNLWSDKPRATPFTNRSLTHLDVLSCVHVPLKHS